MGESETSGGSSLPDSGRMYRELVERSAGGMFVADASGDVVFANSAFCAMLGCSPDELVGRAVSDLMPPKDTDRSVPLGDLLAGESVVTELRLESPNGAWLPVEISAQRLDDGRLQGIVRDIARRDTTEEELRAAVRDLARSNRDLQEFAYVASHDLQEPLRMVSSYTELLRKRYEGRLDSDADEFIGYATDGAHRMQRMIDDLLQYSRVATHGRPPEPVDTAAVARDTVEQLAKAVEESGAIIEIGDLPVVTADRGQIERVFGNLLGNAIKFRRSDVVPRIDVSARRSGLMWEFCVADNGIGIDPKFEERVFTMFQRLHTREEYAGTGIGLAICRRIVERHGGTIRVEPNTTGGSTFSFTLPAVAAPAEGSGLAPSASIEGER